MYDELEELQNEFFGDGKNSQIDESILSGEKTVPYADVEIARMIGKETPEYKASLELGTPPRRATKLTRSDVATMLFDSGDSKELYPLAEALWGGAKINNEQKLFLIHYLASGTVSNALAASGTSMAEYKVWIKYPEFYDVMVEFTNSIADGLERVALARALVSDRVLIKLLESYRPNKYGRRTQIMGSGRNGEIEINVNSWADLTKSAVENAEIINAEFDEMEIDTGDVRPPSEALTEEDLDRIRID